MAIKFEDKEANNINKRQVTVKYVLFILPIISVGFVRNLFGSASSLLITISDPKVIKIAKKEKIIKFSSKVRFPLFNSFSFFAYLEKSPKFKITIE